MKKINAFIISLFFIVLISCENNKSYYEQFNNDKAFTTRILDLNKTLAEIRQEEKGELEEDNVNFLSYEYKIGKTDSYVISYLFDEKGCYEIGIDGYFRFEKDAINVVEGIQTEMSESNYGKGSDDNSLNRWRNDDSSISIELDYKDMKRGMFVATIFANE